MEDALWSRLRAARLAGVWPGLSAAEDAVFSFYRPLAAALVDRGRLAGSVSTSAALESAENRLAFAVLLWPYQQSDGFRRYAERAILIHLRHADPRPQRRTRRPRADDRTSFIQAPRTTFQ